MRIFTDEHREKLRVAQTGKKMSLEAREKMRAAKIGKVGNNVGKRHSDDTRKKMSISRTGKKRTADSIIKISGENSPHWKGGIAKNREYISWLKNKRNKVLKRIKIEVGSHSFEEWQELKKMHSNTCPCCGKSEPEIKLTEDHIVPLSKGGSDLIDNIQPLCKKCNSKKYNKIIKFKIYEQSFTHWKPDERCGTKDHSIREECRYLLDGDQ